MMHWMLLPFRRYFQMSGRARRKEYWGFTLLMVLVSAAIYIVFGDTQSVRSTGSFAAYSNLSPTGQFINGLFSLVTFVPSITVMSRRLHDVDRSMWWILLALIPFLGWLVLLIFLCLDGTSGRNRFGPDPKGRDLGDVFS